MNVPQDMDGPEDPFPRIWVDDPDGVFRLIDAIITGLAERHPDERRVLHELDGFVVDLEMAVRHCAAQS